MSQAVQITLLYKCTDLEEELVLGEPLHGLEEVGGEGQLVAELPLAAQPDGVVVPDLAQGRLGALHVLTVPDDIYFRYLILVDFDIFAPPTTHLEMLYCLLS